MSAQIVDYAAMLADLEAKKAVIESAIVSVRAAMAAGALGVSVGDSLAFKDSASAVQATAFDGDIPSGLFTGKSIPEAAKLYLSMVNRKQTTKEIAQALEEGGLHTTAENFAETVNAGLFRASRNFGEIVRVKGQWALAEWYKGMRVGPQENKAPAKKRKKAKKRKAKADAASQVTPPPKEESPNPRTAHLPPRGGMGIQSEIETYFAEHGVELSAKEIADTLDVRIQTVALICAKLAREGKVQKLPNGKFLKPKVPHAMPKAS